MSGIVVDASITLSWFFPDEQSALSVRVLEEIINGEPLIVQAFWSAEVLNGLLNGERRGRATREQVESFLVRLRRLNPSMSHLSRARMWGAVQRICCERRLTPYDALYIELALREKCPLATLDLRQRTAAVDLGVQCL